MAIMLDPGLWVFLLFLSGETTGKQNAISKGNTDSRLHVTGMFPFSPRQSAGYRRLARERTLEITQRYCFSLQMEKLRPRGV